VRQLSSSAALAVAARGAPAASKTACAFGSSHGPQAAGPRPAGDGLEVLVSCDAADAAGSAGADLRAHGITSDYPLHLDIGGVVPAGADRTVTAASSG
jgi:hypothetical protein